MVKNLKEAKYIDLQEVLTVLARPREELPAAGVKSLTVFKSLTREAATAQSDIDLLVAFSRPVGLLGPISVCGRSWPRFWGGRCLDRQINV